MARGDTASLLAASVAGFSLNAARSFHGQHHEDQLMTHAQPSSHACPDLVTMYLISLPFRAPDAIVNASSTTDLLPDNMYGTHESSTAHNVEPPSRLRASTSATPLWLPSQMCCTDATCAQRVPVLEVCPCHWVTDELLRPDKSDDDVTVSTHHPTSTTSIRRTHEE